MGPQLLIAKVVGQFPRVRNYTYIRDITGRSFRSVTFDRTELTIGPSLETQREREREREREMETVR